MWTRCWVCDQKPKKCAGFTYSLSRRGSLSPERREGGGPYSACRRWLGQTVCNSSSVLPNHGIWACWAGMASSLCSLLLVCRLHSTGASP